jgi:RimJ/RimL family protein N-acetyltransferase
MKPMATLPASPSTGELVLRAWTDQDVEALIEAYRDPVLRRWTDRPVTDLAQAQRWIGVQKRGLATGERWSYAVDEVDARTGIPRLVANVALKPRPPETARAEVGYWTTAPGRGRGIATRALDALTAWAFDAFAGQGLERLDLLHDVRNPASCRVAEKAGYAFSRVISAPAPSPDTGHLHVRR